MKGKPGPGCRCLQTRTATPPRRSARLPGSSPESFRDRDREERREEQGRTSKNHGSRTTSSRTHSSDTPKAAARRRIEGSVRIARKTAIRAHPERRETPTRKYRGVPDHRGPGDRPFWSRPGAKRFPHEAAQTGAEALRDMTFLGRRCPPSPHRMNRVSIEHRVPDIPARPHPPGPAPRSPGSTGVADRGRHQNASSARTGDRVPVRSA